MTDTNDTAPGRPLSPEDCRRIVSVLEDVIDARSPIELGERLPGALARHLGWADGFDPVTLRITSAERTGGRRAAEVAQVLQSFLDRLFRSPSYEQPVDDGALTPREGEIARLVAEGLTNRQIATRLGITTGTVKKHLTSALTKSDCTNRTQLAILWRDARTRDR